jgi:hypothetical protein
MFIVPAATFQFTNEDEVSIGTHIYRTATLGCCRAVCWTKDGQYICALIGDCEIPSLLAVAEAWHTDDGSQRGDNFLGSGSRRTYAILTDF